MRGIMTALMLVCISVISKGQDSIRVLSGKVIGGTIIKTSPYEVTYKKGYLKATHYYSSGNTRRISTSKIREIIYANGKRDTVMPVARRGKDTGSRCFTKDDFYRLGENDAKLYYTRYNGAAAATFLATFPGSPILGLIVATSTSLSKPNAMKFTYPNADYLNNYDYLDGYAKRAHKFKRGKVWMHWGMGCSLNAATYLVLTKR